MAQTPAVQQWQSHIRVLGALTSDTEPHSKPSYLLIYWIQIDFQKNNWQVWLSFFLPLILLSGKSIRNEQHLKPYIFMTQNILISYINLRSYNLKEYSFVYMCSNNIIKEHAKQIYIYIYIRFVLKKIKWKSKIILFSTVFSFNVRQ